MTRWIERLYLRRLEPWYRPWRRKRVTVTVNGVVVFEATGRSRRRLHRLFREWSRHEPELSRRIAEAALNELRRRRRRGRLEREGPSAEATP